MPEELEFLFMFGGCSLRGCKSQYPPRKTQLSGHDFERPTGMLHVSCNADLHVYAPLRSFRSEVSKGRFTSARDLGYVAPHFHLS